MRRGGGVAGIWPPASAARNGQIQQEPWVGHPLLQPLSSRSETVPQVEPLRKNHLSSSVGGIGELFFFILTKVFGNYLSMCCKMKLHLDMDYTNLAQICLDIQTHGSSRTHARRVGNFFYFLRNRTLFFMLVMQPLVVLGSGKADRTWKPSFGFYFFFV